MPGTDLMVIKPSGVAYADLTPGNMVLCDLDGQPVEDGYSPSSDTATHAYVYRHMPQVGGVVHTHSTYATAWAALGEAIPCVITAMADEFGGEIPVGPFALIGSDEIGRGIVATLDGHRSPAVLMQPPRRVHHRRHRPGRGQGRDDVRGRGQDRAPGPGLRRAGAAPAGPGGRTAQALHGAVRPALTARALTAVPSAERYDPKKGLP